MRELQNESLSRYTTLGVGGLAPRLVEVENEGEIVAACRDLGPTLLVLGGGSNLVVADAGVSRPVLALRNRGIARSRKTPRGTEPEHAHEPVHAGETEHASETLVTVTANAGEPWDDFVEDCVDRGLVGVECLSGIPGLVGATPIQNVGAYGQQVSDVIKGVRALDRHTSQIVELERDKCGFGYRTSAFKTSHAGRYILLAVHFTLREGTPRPPTHDQLAARLAYKTDAKSSRPAAHDVREAVLKLRRSKSMVVDPQDPDSRSAGSFFLNPVVSAEKAERIEKQIVTSPQASLHASPQALPMPRYPAEGNRTKLAAAWLIEQAGFSKGHGVGPVGLSPKHTLAIVNRGNAKAAQIVAFAQEIQQAVSQRFGIHLVPEPVFWGFGDALDLHRG